MSEFTTLAHETHAEAGSARPAARKISVAARVVLALVAGLCVGLLAQAWQASGSAAAAWARVNHWAAGEGDAGNLQALLPARAPVLLPVAATTGQGSAQAAQSGPAPRPMRMDAAVLVGGQVHSAEAGRIALPAGTRFELRVSANQSGRLEVYAVNPQGIQAAEPLWSTPMDGDAPVSSPALRLDGTRGLETLKLVLRGSAGEVLARKQLQIWHL